MGKKKSRKGSGWGGRREGAGRKPRVQDPVKVTLLIDGDDVEALEQLAETDEVGFSQYIRKVLHRHVGSRGKKQRRG